MTTSPNPCSLPSRAHIAHAFGAFCPSFRIAELRAIAIRDYDAMIAARDAFMRSEITLTAFSNANDAFFISRRDYRRFCFAFNTAPIDDYTIAI